MLGMKCSACCITRSSRLSALLFLSGFGFLGAVAQNGYGQDPSASPTASASQASTPLVLSVKDMIASNTLDTSASPPYHLKLGFQIYDFQGHAGEQGTLEYWWAGPAGSYLTLSTPSLGTRHTLSSDDLPDVKARRTVYLVSQLFQEFRAPGDALGPPEAQVVTEERVIGASVLTCMHKELPPSIPSAQRLEVCADRQTGTIRLVHGPLSGVVRNHTGVFGAKRVALDLDLSWLDVRAITGHVETLKAFNPALEHLALESSSTASQGSSEPAGIRTGVVAGRKLSGDQPKYPEEARRVLIQGSVLLDAEITEAGRVTNLFPIESSSALLTDSAIAAVRTWTYQPYLINDKPVRVETTITVNFALHLNR